MLVLVLLLSNAGCMQGEKNETTGQASGILNHPPVIKAVSLLPSPLTLSAPPTVLVEAQDLDQQTIGFRYRWLVNGRPVDGQAKNQLPVELLKRGDRVVVEVTPSDGLTEGSPFKSEPVTVQNTPPIVSHVTIESDEQSFIRRVVAKSEISDPDGDSVTVVYRWRRNDAIVKEGEAHDLDVTGLLTNDSIQVEVLASDGIADAAPVSSEVFVMSNAAPRFTSYPSVAIQGGRYAYHAVANDPDGDPVTYLLEVAPPGMTIDPQSGLIQWTVSPEMKGSHRVRVVASDGRGGGASQEFDLSLVTLAQSS
jgi:hypothetical protein